SALDASCPEVLLFVAEALVHLAAHGLGHAPEGLQHFATGRGQHAAAAGASAGVGGDKRKARRLLHLSQLLPGRAVGESERLRGGGNRAVGFHRLEQLRAILAHDHGAAALDPDLRADARCAVCTPGSRIARLRTHSRAVRASVTVLPHRATRIEEKLMLRTRALLML